GSIGRSTLSVVESFPDRFQVVSLAAGRNVDLAFEQAKRWRPRVLSVALESQAENLKHRLKSAGITGIEVAGVHACTGFVQQKKFGLGGKCAGDLKTALRSIREVTCQHVAFISQTHKIQQSLGFGKSHLFLLNDTWQT